MSASAWTPDEVKTLDQIVQAVALAAGMVVEATFYETDDGVPMVSLGPEGVDAWWTLWRAQDGYVYLRRPDQGVQFSAALKAHTRTILMTVPACAPWAARGVIETNAFTVPTVRA